MLQIKTTFAKVYEIGSLVMLTFPDIERQGEKLTVSASFDGSAQLAINNSDINKVRSVYIQLDHVSSNKWSTFITLMAALVACGFWTPS